MDRPPERAQSRRQMFRRCLRYAALGGLALLSAGVLARGTDSRRKGPCARPLPCGGCPALARCRLPQALSAKRQRER